MIQKITTAILLSLILFFNSLSLVSALEPPEPPSAPSAPEHPAPPTPPSPAEHPKPPEPPSGSSNQKAPDVTSDPTPHQSSDQSSDSTAPDSSSDAVPNAGGDSAISTGNSNNSTLAVTNGNNNQTSSNSTGGSLEASNNGNGSDSHNDAEVSTQKNAQTLQNNQALVDNGIAEGSSTGHNNSSQNVGNSAVRSGDSNTNGTVITGLNTNLDGVEVSQFDIADNHTGDIILDFSTPCTSQCAKKINATNSGNGSGSSNNSQVSENSSANTFQNNQADINNEFILTADSGGNIASQNTGGDSSIISGDANVAANILTFANNNVAGDVIIGVVNIFGNLVGDIILNQDQLDKLSGCASNCSPPSSVSNSGNGSDSSNLAQPSASTSDNTFQSNDATIKNNLVFDAQTGQNITSDNTGGNSQIVTGASETNSSVINIANSNIDQGVWWLVIVNEAGKWVGKLIGAPNGANVEASAGTDLLLDDQGNVTATVNKGNGSGSSNQATTTATTSDTTSQNNQADVNNNIHLSANSGGNVASQNTGGDSNIKTGDANIIANLVNFVNNNISGDAKLVVTLVNVFGTWMGDFVAPGQSKQNSAPQPSPAANASIPPTVKLTPSIADSHNVSSSSSAYQVNQTSSQITYLNNYYNIQTGQPSGRTANYTGSPITLSPQVEGVKVASSKFPQPLTDSLIQSNQVNNKVIKINLAWLLIILPTLAGLYILSRKINLRFRN